MDNALTPREIQSRIRSGASVEDVAADSGMDVDKVEAFAGPVLAEREHIAGAAQTSTIRRRGEAGTHRRLGELISQRLGARGIDAEDVEWDAWRQADLKWRIIARLGAADEAEQREAEFIFDPKARFCVAHNGDARWMIGEEPPGAPPEEENTVDFDDELALVRAVTEPVVEGPGDDVPASALMHDAHEDTSQLDRLYDMLSGISEDSVRIYTGILDPVLYDDEHEESDPEGTPEPEEQEKDPEWEAEANEPTRRVILDAPIDVDDPADTSPAAEDTSQDVLVGHDEGHPKPPKPRKRRAKVPTWDEIMFGGPSK